MPVTYDASVARLVDALEQVGLTARTETSLTRQSTDLVIDVNGVPLFIDVKTVSTAMPDGLDRRISDWTVDSQPEQAHLLVADRIVAAAREILRERGWSWLDLRGHLRLSGPGVLVDVPVRSVSAGTAAQRARTFTGKVALEVATALLLAPRKPLTIRGLARDLRHSPSTVSTVITAFRAAQLIDEQNLPVLPDLFWELAGAWRPTSISVARIQLISDPTIAGSLHPEFEDVQEKAGWAVSDTLAAAAYGAPAAVRAGYPPDFYVPDETTAQRAATMLGVPVSEDVRGATLRVAPVPQACTLRRPAPASGLPWPLAHPLFVALDLATDPGRGREILENWEPPKDVTRVW